MVSHSRALKSPLQFAAQVLAALSLSLQRIMAGCPKIKSVAVIGAGASGAITAAALKAEQSFDRIRIFERRESPGGMWVFDAAVRPSLVVPPGTIAPVVDIPLEAPKSLPCVTPPNRQERFSRTPIYSSLMTNTPSVVMCFSDVAFPRGPFVPHHVARQYVESYFSIHQTDSLLVLNTTVEDLSQVASPSCEGGKEWKLVLRKHEPVQDVDIWWEENFDAVVIATGHYSIPNIPHVKGLNEYIEKFPGRIVHAKTYRKPHIFTSQRVVVVGSGISAIEIAKDLVPVAQLPVYMSRRSAPKALIPIEGVEKRPMISEYLPNGRILFDNGEYLDDVDAVIYCTGYQPSYPFWNVKANGRPLWDYERDKLINSYLHTFFQDFPNLGIVGIQRAITFRSFEYQAVALARSFAGRNAVDLPTVDEQVEWERKADEESRANNRTFHALGVEDGGLRLWMEMLYKFAGQCTLSGKGRNPPVFGEKEQEVIMKQKRAELLSERRILLGQPDDGWIQVGETKYKLLGFV